MDDLFEDFIGALAMLFVAITIGAVLVPLIVIGATAAGIAYLSFLGGRAFVRWIIEICQPTAQEQIEAALRDSKATMQAAVKAVE